MQVQALPLLFLVTVDGKHVYVNPWHVRAIMEIGIAPGRIGTRLQFGNGDNLDFDLPVGRLIGKLCEQATLIIGSGVEVPRVVWPPYGYEVSSPPG